MDQREPGPPTVFPPIVNELLILCWLLLMGGRWVVGQFLTASGIVSVERMSVFDETVGLRCYLILVVITLIHVALRALRSIRSPDPPDAASPPGPAITRGPATEKQKTLPR